MVEIEVVRESPSARERSAFLGLILLLSLGCTANPGSSGRDSGGGEDAAASLPTLTVSGRVVDYESCFEGCLAVPDVVVAWGGAPEVIRSEPTGADGAFTLPGVPSGIRSDLLAIPQGSTGAGFATTLNAMILSRGQTTNVFALQVVVLPRDARSIIAAFEAETGTRLDRDGGYIGQVVNDAAGGGFDAAAGVDVAHAPTQGAIRFLDAVPRLVPTEPAFQPPDATTTSIFGVFVLGGSGTLVDPVTFAPGSPPSGYRTVVTPLIPGVVSYGLHPPR